MGNYERANLCRAGAPVYREEIVERRQLAGKRRLRRKIINANFERLGVHCRQAAGVP